MPIIGIGVKVVQTVELERVYQAMCPYCKAETLAAIRQGKMLEPAQPCRHYQGMIVDDNGGLSIVYRGILP